MFEFDPHTHSIASGHGTRDTVADIAKKAAARGLKMVSITDHGPATAGSSRASYFRNLSYAPRRRCGIQVLYGVELNILDKDGSVDLDSQTLSLLDYAIVGMHRPLYTCGTLEENTFAYVRAMQHPKVKIVAHPEDTKFPVDFEALVVAGKRLGVVLEINESSLSPEGYRGDVKENVERILHFCKKHNHPIVLSSDSHGRHGVGKFKYATELLAACDFPQALVLNYSAKNFKSFIEI